MKKIHNYSEEYKYTFVKLYNAEYYCYAICYVIYYKLLFFDRIKNI